MATGRHGQLGHSGEVKVLNRLKFKAKLKHD